MIARFGRAPGRLDLMGGVADYSGALVLEVPTVVSTEVRAVPSSSLVVGPVELTREEVVRLADSDYASMRDALAGVQKWTLYLIGVALVLVKHGVITPPMVRLEVESDVPVSVGVSSSAALEVATARALTGDGIDPLRLAMLCQEAENEVVGAPCGAMDQIAVSLGSAGSVLPILCRPGDVGSPLGLPVDLEVVGWPTGAAHDVGGLPYRRARTAAFMGKRMVEDSTASRYRWISDIPADQADLLPDIVSGAAFRDRWGEIDDPVTVVDDGVCYPVRAATAFGRAEDRRSRSLLSALRKSDRRGVRDLFAASHVAYESMGLGHPAADAVVAEALDRPAVHGARSSGGGSGGTVAVLCERGALDDVAGMIR